MFVECRHILPRGTKCKSPALRAKLYCYFHQQLHTYTQDGTRADNDPVLLPSLEDARGIQLALMQITGSLATGRLSRRRAATLLYGLQIGLQALARISEIAPQELVEATACDGFGADLAASNEPCKPYADCAACPQQDACVHIARHNTQSVRDLIDAEHARDHSADREPVALSAPEPITGNTQVQPSRELVQETINKLRRRKPEPEPTREDLDRMALEISYAAATGSWPEDLNISPS